MKKIYRDLVYVLLLPLVAGAVYWEIQQKMSAMGHNLALVGIILAFCGLAAAWNRYDETLQLKDLLDQMRTGEPRFAGQTIVESRTAIQGVKAPAPREDWRSSPVEDGHAVVLRPLDTPRK